MAKKAGGRNGRWTGGRGGRTEGHAGKAVGAVCASGQAHVLPLALRTVWLEEGAAWGALGLASAGSGLLTAYSGRGGGSDALRQAVGWLAVLEEHQNDFILEICPCGALSVPWLSQPRAAGTCSTHNCTHPVSYRSAGKRAGGKGSQAHVCSCSLWHAWFLSSSLFPFLHPSFFPRHVFQVDSAAERMKTCRGSGQDCGGETVLGSTESAVGPGGCQAGKGVPSPAWSQTRRGKGWGHKGQSGARGGQGSHQVGECPASPRAGCAPQPHCRLESGAGGQRAGLLNLAQNKQPSAAGENSWPIFQADREMVEPFSSGPVPTESCSCINPLWLDGSGELVPGLALAPQGWGFSHLTCALAPSPGFLLLVC